MDYLGVLLFPMYCLVVENALSGHSSSPHTFFIHLLYLCLGDSFDVFASATCSVESAITNTAESNTVIATSPNTLLAMQLVIDLFLIN